MFVNFDQVENCRLNKGSRGRLIDHAKKLMDKKELKGYDARYIWEQTRNLIDESN